MSSAAKQIFMSARPPGFSGKGDKYWVEAVPELRRVLQKAQNSFAYPSCRLPDAAWSEVAVLLVEWAEDIHNDLGLWRTVEAHHCRCFGTALPFMSVLPGEELRGFDPRRIQFFLWTLWPCFNPDLVLLPTHQDLRRLAEAASRFLTERMARVPQDSGLQHFLATSNEFGWDIKRKLVWLGLNSYLFRFLFRKFIEVRKRQPDFAAKDDFVCAHCTEWSGLGVIDVLAGALDLPEADRAGLRTWYERHQSFFRVLAWHEEGGEVKFITTRNVVNGQPYTIRMNITRCPFPVGAVVAGALTPWRGEWVWSGEQNSFEKLPESDDAILCKDLLEKSSALTYCYCPAAADKALESTRKHHAQFVAYYGGDLISFPDGLTLAAAEQKRLSAEWARADPQTVARAMAEHALTHPRPRMSFPPEFLNHERGIGAFSNPDEGMELLVEFNHIVSGLRKKGVGLTEDELHALRGVITSAVISPAFVRRLVAEHGAESIADAYLLRDGPVELALEYLLRRYKGHFYRKRYPSLTQLQPVGSLADTTKG